MRKPRDWRDPEARLRPRWGNIEVNLTKKELMEIVNRAEYREYGLRRDNVERKVGDICENTHYFNEFANYHEDSEESELDGFLCSRLHPYPPLPHPLESVQFDSWWESGSYDLGKYIHLVGGNHAMWSGKGRFEGVIENAVVLATGEFYWSHEYTRIG